MSDVRFKPLPASFNGKPWSKALLASLDAATLKRLIATYGATALNAAIAIHAARAAGRQ